MANNGTTLRVLHIEDNPADAVFVRELLSDTGAHWTLTHVRRLSEGLKILGEQGFDGLLLDLDLIDSRGLETLETVHRVYPAIPIVVLSGFKDETFGFKSLEKGTQDYLVKGQINGSMLVRAMRYAIERKRTDIALQESEARLSSLFREAAIGMTVLSLEGQFTKVNPAFCEFLGYAEKELLGKALREVTFLEDWQKTSMLLHQLLSDDETVRKFEKRYRFKTGGLVWGETRAVLVRDGLGNPAYFVVQVVDITARKLAENALRESEARFRTLTERSTDLVLILDGRGALLYKSLNVEHILGFPEKVELGEKITDLVHPDDQMELKRLLMEGVEQPGAIRKGEIRLRHRTGAWRVMEAAARNLLDDAVIQGVVLNMRDITERKEAEAALKESEERFRILVQRAPEAIAVYDVDLDRFVDVNFNAERLFGCPAEELLRTGLRKFFAPEQPDGKPRAESMAQHAEQALAGNEVVFDRLIHNAEGRDVHCEVRLVRLPSANRRLLRASYIDISGRKQAEEALRQSEERFKSAFEYSPIGMAWVSLEGKWVKVNASVCELLGYTEEELREKTFQDITYPADLEKDLDNVRRLLAGEIATYKFEKRYYHKKGHIVWVLLAAGLIKDRSGRPLYFISQIEDITERKRAEEAIVESRQMLKAVLDTIPVRVFWKDLKLKYLGCNKHFASDAGFKNPEELVGKDDFQMAWREQAEMYQADDRKVMESGIPVLNYEEPQTSPAGDTIWLRTSKVALRNTKGDIIGILGTYEDITVRRQEELALKEAKENAERTAGELARSNRDLEEFARIVCHDLKEPLRMITGFLQLIQTKYQPSLDAKGIEYIAFAVEGSLRMKGLIDRMLEYARAGGRTQDLAPTPLEKSLKAAMLNLKERIDKAGAIVSHDPLPEVMAEADQMTQVFQNLVCNAIKFTKGRPEIHVGALMQDGNWLISVRDNGIGIDPKHKDRVFEVFQRLNEREQYEGEGMGLAICKKIIERHNGRIWVESAPGEGSTFYFTVPARIRAAAPKGPPKGEPDPSCVRETAAV